MSIILCIFCKLYLCTTITYCLYFTVCLSYSFSSSMPKVDYVDKRVSALKLAFRSLSAHKNLKWSMSGSGSGGYCQKEDNPLIYFLYMLFYVFIFSGTHHNYDDTHIYSTISLRGIEVLCCSHVLPVSSNSAFGHIVFKSKENF
jgi:hypothetical protein